jgi:PPOX class probable F420-dependent enzyme
MNLRWEAPRGRRLKALHEALGKERIYAVDSRKSGAYAGMSTNRLTPFAHEKYLNLETYRKIGTPVVTPVWFAEAHGTLYIYSLADAGKVKRIRQNSKIRIAPCDAHGHPKGAWLEAKARLLDARGATLGHTLLNQKYGWVKRIGDAFSWLRQRQRIVIAIDLV